LLHEPVTIPAGSLVDFSYEALFAFTGTVEKVTVELKPEAAAAGAPKG
jgi:hypothetical protein